MPINIARKNISTATKSEYSRLKKVFVHDLNYTGYKNIVSNAKNKVLGNIPSEILSAALKTKDKELTIKRIQNGFAAAAEKLREIHSLKTESVKMHILDKEDIKKTYEMIIDGEWDCYDYLKKRIKNSLINKETNSTIEATAEKLIKHSMSEILPQNTNIKLKCLGEGNFSTAYKIEFRDTHNKKVFNDYTMKLYKDSKENAIIELNIENKIREVLFNLPDNEIKELHKRLPVYKSGSKETWEKIIKKFRNTHRPMNRKELEESIRKEVQIRQCTSNTNGIYAEANSYNYIANALGHPVSSTNLVEHYMFNLKNNFNISAYSDSSLGPIKKHINFSKIGLLPIDPYDNYGNIVYGRIIDLGGIVKSNPILTDKTVLKFFKKIMNRSTEKERQQVLCDLEKMVKNPRTPHRGKIEKAINLAKNIKSCYEC